MEPGGLWPRGVFPENWESVESKLCKGLQTTDWQLIGNWIGRPCPARGAEPSNFSRPFAGVK